MVFHFIERTLELATGQSFANRLPPDSLHSNFEVEIEKQGRMDITVTDIEATTAEKEEKVSEWKPRRQEWMVMITLAIISLMVALDATILVPVLPTLAVDLHGTANEALWTGTSYLLTSAVFQPFIAALSDIFGRRELLFPSLLLFTAGTAICCVAHDFTVMLAGRCVQGVGGGGIITLSQVIFADIIPLRQRPKYFSIILASWAVGSVLGPFIGGLFVGKVTWRACFYLNFPFCGLGLPMVVFLIPLKTTKTSLKAKLLRIDWLGGLLFIGGLTSTLIAITWGGVQFAWTSPQSLIPLAIGTTALIASLAWERYGAIEPFLRHSLFHSPSAIAAYLCALLQGLLLFTALYYVPFFLNAMLRKSPLQSGIDLFPATCLILPGSAIVSLLITRLGHFRVFMWAGWAVSTVGTGLFLRLNGHTPTWYWALVLGVFGLGMGMVLSSVNFATQANAKVRDAGHAAAMYAFCRSLGMAVGVAISGTVFQNLMAGKLGQLGLEMDIARDAEAYLSVLRRLEATNSSAAAYVLTAYLRGFWGVFVLMLGLSGLGLMMSLCVKHREMDKRLNSQYTLDRSSRSSRFLEGTQRNSRIVDGEVRPASDATLLGVEEGPMTPIRESKVVFSDQIPAAGNRGSLTHPEVAVVRVSRSSDNMTEHIGTRPVSEEVLWDGRASQCHGKGPIWGVS